LNILNEISKNSQVLQMVQGIQVKHNKIYYLA